jgi:hypothetical protein
MTLRFAVVVFSALTALASHVVQRPGASAERAGRQALKTSARKSVPLWFEHP